MEIWEHPSLKWPSTWASHPKKPPTFGNGKLCKFHNEYGHGTEECFHLKDEIKRLVRDNKLSRYVGRQMRAEEDRREDRREQREEQRVEREELPPPPPLPRNGALQPEKLTIHMIMDGCTEGDSNRARRAMLHSIKEWETGGLVQPVFQDMVVEFGKMIGLRFNVHRPMPGLFKLRLVGTMSSRFLLILGARWMSCSWIVSRG